MGDISTKSGLERAPAIGCRMFLRMRIKAIVLPSGRIARANVRMVLIASSVKTDARRRISTWFRDLL